MGYAVLEAPELCFPVNFRFWLHLYRLGDLELDYLFLINYKDDLAVASIITHLINQVSQLLQILGAKPIDESIN
jgi:hypothetical protein